MALSKLEFRDAVEAGAGARVVGSQGGKFHIVCGERGCVAEKGAAIGFPSLNHAADFLQRCGVVEFSVDVRLWRAPDTGRDLGVARP